MAFKRLFSYADVDIPNRSSHDEFHRHSFSVKCGTLTPSFVDFLVPGDIVDVAPKFQVQMAPQATDFIGRINLRTELFFVPCRTLWAGWKDFITYASDGVGGPAPTDPNYHAKYLPGAYLDSNSQTLVEHTIFDYDAYTSISDQPSVNAQIESLISEVYNAYSSKDFAFFISSESFSILGPGTLSDYLGFKVNTLSNSISDDVKQDYVDSFGKLLNHKDNIRTWLRSTEFRQYLQAGDPVYVHDYSTDSVTAFRFTFDQPQSQPYVEAQWDSVNLIIKFVNPVFDFSSEESGSIIINNILPHACYHKIYDDWYRDPRIQKPLFPSALGDSPSEFANSIPYITKFGAGFTKKLYRGSGLLFYDGKSIFDLRQRLWQKDFFTTMTSEPQSGDAMKVSFDTSGDTGEFTIASLRVANSMQLWRERNNLVSPRYGDVQYAQYGEYPDDAVTDRSIYLGSVTCEIYNKTVYQQGEFTGNSNNPFNVIGSKYATPVGVGQGSLCQNYKVKEHGFLMALTSLVPEASYSSGTRRFFHYDQIDDIAFPLLQNVGDQPVYAREIIDTYKGNGNESVIGYTGRYNEYKFINDHISGLLRDGESLQSFALQRSFSSPPVLGASFLEIPVNYLDQVSAVGIENSKYGAWIESAWVYNKSSKFSENNAIPTLGRMEDVHKITVPKGGTRL